MKPFLIKLFIISILITQVCCNKCKTKTEGPYTLSTVDLSMIPYRGNETLVYKNLAGDSVTFIGVKRYSRIDHGDTLRKEEPLCAVAEWQYEWNFSTFSYSANGDMWVGESNNRNRRIFEIWFEFHTPIDFWYDNIVSINSGNFYCNNNQIAPIDSLLIGNNKYYSVFEFYYNGCSKPALPIIYYTIAQGIVGFKTTNSDYWYLK
jgi:hypothetical protein